MSSRRFRTAAMAVLAAIAIVGLDFTIAVDPTLAGTAVLQPCVDGPTQPQQPWETHDDPLRWDIFTGCPAITLFQAKPYSPGIPTTEYAYFPGQREIRAQITAVEFDLSGSDGSETSMIQGLRVCGQSVCSGLRKPSGSDVKVPEHHRMTFADVEIPSDADHLRFVGSCTIPDRTCDQPRPLEVRNIRIEFEDEIDPTAQFLQPAPGAGSDLIRFDEWNSGRRTLQVSAEDLGGAGVQRIKWMVGAVGFWTSGVGCGLEHEYETVPVAKLCPQEAQYTHSVNLTGTLSFMGLEAGDNTVEAEVFDAAGNSSGRFSRQFKADNTRPSFTDFRVTTVNDRGWQSDAKFDVRWRNTGESTETASQSGIASIQYDIDPLDSGLPNPALVTVPAEDFSSLTGLDIPEPGRWRITIWLVDRAGNVSLPREASVARDVVIPRAPVVETVPVIGGPGLRAGAEIEWNRPSNENQILSNICGFASLVDRAPLTDPGEHPNLPRDASSVRLPAVLESGEHYLHVRAVSCAGVLGQVAHRMFEVDSDPPVLSFSSPTDTGWYTTAVPFGVSAIDYGGTSTVRTRVASEWTSWIGSLPLEIDLEDGTHTVEVEGRDPAGNVSAHSQQVKFDGTAPTAMFMRQDPDHPTQVQATVSDTTSGVAAASLQFRVPGGPWRALGSNVAYASDRKSADLLARFPDGDLPDGRYELAVVVTDAAGHTTTSTVFADGAPMILVTPLRAASNLTAGFRPWVSTRSCRGSGAKRRCTTTRVRSRTESVELTTVDHGKSERVHGRLLDASGEPLGGRRLDVHEETLGGARRLIGSVSTDAAGAYSLLVRPKTSRRIHFRFNGSDKHSATASSVRLLVRAGVSLSISKKSIRRGQSVKLSGRVLLAGAAIPTAGVPIQLEVRTSRGWQPFPIETYAGADGRFSTSHRFKRSGIAYEFRARARWTEGWPFESGVSRSRKLVVR